MENLKKLQYFRMVVFTIESMYMLKLKLKSQLT